MNANQRIDELVTLLKKDMKSLLITQKSVRQYPYPDSREAALSTLRKQFDEYEHICILLLSGRMQEKNWTYLIHILNKHNQGYEIKMEQLKAMPETIRVYAGIDKVVPLHRLCIQLLDYSKQQKASAIALAEAKE